MRLNSAHRPWAVIRIRLVIAKQLATRFPDAPPPAEVHTVLSSNETVGRSHVEGDDRHPLVNEFPLSEDESADRLRWAQRSTLGPLNRRPRWAPSRLSPPQAAPRTRPLPFIRKAWS